MDSEVRVLFIYPSQFMQTGLPLAIACLAGALKANGISVRVFDTYPYQMFDEENEQELRANRHHSTIEVDYASKGIFPKQSDPFDDFQRVLEEYQPTIVGMSAVESVFERGCLFTRRVKAWRNIPTIAGGVFPTLAPHVAIAEPSLDMVCVGEGESAMVELCRRVASGQDTSSIEGVWAKTPTGIVENGRRLESLSELPLPAFDVFDRATFLRPMRGNLFKTIPVEFSRGCPYQCTFCAEPALEKMFKGDSGSSFFRKKTVTQVVSELQAAIRDHNPEFFYFNSETFLAITQREFDEFIEAYREIRVPFWVQTRPETVSEEKLRALKEVGLFWLSIGVEHGDEAFRSRIVKRPMKNETLFEVVRMLDRCEQGASCNMILGFPFETRELAVETIRLARALYQTNPRIRCNLSVYAPFRGSEMYEMCVRYGYWDESVPFISETNISQPGFLKSELLPLDVLEGLYRTFPLHVYLPEEFQNRIALAEQLTPDGNAEYETLNAMVERFLSRPIADVQKEPVWKALSPPFAIPDDMPPKSAVAPRMGTPHSARRLQVIAI